MSASQPLEQNTHASAVVEAAGLVFDFSHHLASAAELKAFEAEAQAVGLSDKIEDLFEGRVVNSTEHQAAMHTALRSTKPAAHEAYALAQATDAQMKNLLEKIQAKGRGIRHIIHIGIGGSLLGPKLVLEALASQARYDVHFISNLDPLERERAMQVCDPKATVVVVASKSFTTLETLENAKVLRAWLQNDRHLIGVTANPMAATQFGVMPEQVLAFHSTIGGRYSVWSAVGVTIALALGYESLVALRAGAALMDHHVRSAKPYTQNAAIRAAWLDVFYSRRNAQALAVLPYASALASLPAYLQQLMMESLGKTVDVQGNVVAYTTGVPVFGQVGSDAQHAICQFLHQGTGLVPIDLIGFKNSTPLLNKNLLAQQKALWEGDVNPKEKASFYAGKRPHTTIWAQSLTAQSLGALLAFYEHRTYASACFLNINAFDQPGVQLAKTLLAQGL